MAVVDTKAQQLINADAKPVVPVYSYETNGMLRSSQGKVEIAAGDDDNSIYRLVRLPSNARLVSLTKYNDAITGGDDFDFGLFGTDGSEIDVNAFADAVDLTSADTTGTNILHEANDIDNHGLRLFELAGETEDPGIQYDIGAKGITVGTVAGGLAIDVAWVI